MLVHKQVEIDLGWGVIPVDEELKDVLLVLSEADLIPVWSCQGDPDALTPTGYIAFRSAYWGFRHLRMAEALMGYPILPIQSPVREANGSRYCSGCARMIPHWEHTPNAKDNLDWVLRWVPC